MEQFYNVSSGFEEGILKSTCLKSEERSDINS